jgi:ferredoxin
MSIPITIPGGAKDLADPVDPRDRESLLEKIAIFGSDITTIRARMHNDCVACGRCSDVAHYEAMLLKAGAVLEERFPGVEVILIFVDFDGFYLVEKDEVLVEAMAG